MQKTHQPRFQVHAGEVKQTLSQFMLADGYDIIMDLDKSNGSTIVDKRTGAEYLDFFTCFASIPIGFNHPGLKNEAFADYFFTSAANKPSNSDMYSEEMAAFVKTFNKLALPDYFKYSFFIEGGALAVENALKTAFDWKVKKNFKKGAASEKGHKVLHFREAFHGRSGYTMSLTNTDPNKVDYFPKFDWPRVSNPKIFFPMKERDRELEEREKQCLEEIKNAFLTDKDEIAAIIIEPVQGEGGDNHFRPSFLRQLRNLADENEALLIFDEIQTGTGLTGTMWVHEQLDTIPDLMTFGKKMQVCGFVSTGRIDDIEDNVFHKPGRINSTWGGNLADMVRVTRYLEIIEEENLVAMAAENGSYLLDKLQGLQEEFPAKVSNTRGRGLFCAFDLPSEKRNEFIKKCLDRKLILLGSGKQSIRFRPALNISREMIDRGMEVFRKVLQEL